VTLDLPSLASVCSALAVLGLLFAERQRSQVGKWLTKPLASCGFLAVAWLSGALEHAYGQRLMLGLVLCALGDVLLIPLGTGRVFLAGITSFALGHAAYAWAFSARDQHLVAGVLGLAGVLVVVALTLRWLRPHLPREMQLPVRGYMAVIACMVAAAVSTSAATGQPAIAIGAVAFALSYLSVASDRFVQPRLINLLWGLPLYYLAQVLLALSAKLP
jgi:uncharacterized membrane protein YhhN